jgi:hydrogenase maturation protease
VKSGPLKDAIMIIDNTNKILVLGMGNPLLCDDGVGLSVVETAERMFGSMFVGLGDRVSFRKNYCGGIDMLYDLMEARKAIIVDSVQTGSAAPGHCHEFFLEDLDGICHDRLVYAHGVSLPTVMELGRQCGYAMPEDVVIFGIESSNVTSFSTEPTVNVRKSIMEVVNRIEKRLLAWLSEANLALTSLASAETSAATAMR